MLYGKATNLGLGVENGASMKNLLSLIFILVVVGVLFYQIIILGYVFVPGESLFGFPPWNTYHSPGPWVQFDLLLMFYPWQEFATEWLREGVIPLWNSETLCGAPFVGCGQSGVFAPLNLLFLAGPLKTLFGFVAIVKLLLILTGCFLWLRAQALPHAASVFGALAFGLGGYNQYGLGRANANVSMSLPWFCYFMLVSASKKKPLLGVAAALTLGIGALGGHVESVFYTFVFAFSYTLFLYRRSLMKGLGYATGVILIATALGAVQLYPFLDYLSQSMVLQDRNHKISAAPGLSVRNLLNLITPDSSGNPYDGNYPIARHTYYEITAAYPGILALILALWAMSRLYRRPQVIFFTAWAAVSVSGAYDIPGFSWVVRTLPGFNLGYNVRLTYLLLFALAALASYGCAELLTDPKGKVRYLFGLGGLTLVLASSSFLVPSWQASGITASYAGMRWLQGGAVLLLGLTVISLGVSSVNRYRGFILVVVAAVNLLHFAKRYNDSVPASRIFPPTKGIEALRQGLGPQRMLGLGRAIHPSLGMMYDLRDVRGYDSLAPQRFVELMMLMDPALTERRPDNVLQSVLVHTVKQPLLDLLGVSKVIVPGELWEATQDLTRTSRLRAVYADEMIMLDNPTALERVFFVAGNPRYTEGKTLAFMATEEFDPHTIVYCDDPVSLPQPLTDHRIEANKISWQEVHPGRITIESKLREAGIIVVSENNVRGWRVTSNGVRSVPISVFHSFMGIPVAAGTTTISVDYAPSSYRQGLFLTCYGLMVIVGLSIWALSSRGGSRDAPESSCYC